MMVMSYVIVLGGTLLDNAQLFDQVSQLAASDPLTGLANHRRLIEVMETEIQRSRRTGRSFAILLFDLDGLKKINDNFGHLTGSRAIKRLGTALSQTAAAPSTRRRVTAATNSPSCFRNPARQMPSKQPRESANN